VDFREFSAALGKSLVEHVPRFPLRRTFLAIASSVTSRFAGALQHIFSGKGEGLILATKQKAF